MSARPGQYTPTPEHRANLSKSLRGGKRSEEARAKMSAAAKARIRQPLSEETKAKIGAGNRGKVRRPALEIALAIATASDKPYKQPRCTSATVRWGAAVRERDGHICQRCGTDKGRMDAHHIKPWRTHPELRFDLANGITLCRTCHRAVEPVKRRSSTGTAVRRKL